MKVGDRVLILTDWDAFAGERMPANQRTGELAEMRIASDECGMYHLVTTDSGKAAIVQDSLLLSYQITMSSRLRVIADEL